MNDLGVRIYLGANQASDVDGADLVCVSQGVPLDNPAVAAARIGGIPIESMTSIFFDNYPGPIVGITGSSGKTTTTSLVDAIFTASGRDHVLGGNIGLRSAGAARCRRCRRARPWSRSATPSCS